MSGKSNINKSVKYLNDKKEQRKRKFTRIKASVSIYIIKGLAFIGIATIAVLTSQTVNALLLGAFTYAVGIIFDMWILSGDNSAPVMLWLSVFQWIATFLIIALTIADLILLVSYEELFLSNPSGKQTLSVMIRAWVPIFMYSAGIVSSVVEVYYSLPYDD